MSERIPITALAVIIFTVMLHDFDALVLLITRSGDGCIELAALLKIAPTPAGVAYVVLLSCGCALLAIFSQGSLTVTTSVLLLLPQQALLFVTAAVAWTAMWSGSYADGVQRSFAFIGPDQMIRGLFWILHATAIYSAGIYHRNREAS